MNRQFTASVEVWNSGYKWWPTGFSVPRRGRILAGNPLRTAAGVSEAPLSRDSYYRRYDPFKDEPALFRVLAALDENPDTVCKFANKYGVLSGLRQSRPRSRKALAYAGWIRFIRVMRSAIALWDAIQARSKDGLESYVRWSAGAGTPEWCTPLARTLGVYIRLCRKQYKHGDLITPARDLLDAFIDQRLRTVTLRVAASRLHGGSLELPLFVDSLNDVLWLQFAMSVANERQFRDCEVCRRPFPVSPDENRSDRKTCSDACRAKATRHRRSKASQLHSEGVPPEKIAEQVGSDLTTILGWLGLEDGVKRRRKGRGGGSA